MDKSTQVLAELLSMVRGRQARKSVKAKYVIQQCMQCDDGAVVGCRGLCEFHYGQFKYARAEAAKGVTITRDEAKKGITLADKVQEAKDAFDAMQVAKGNILCSQQGKHNKTNRFIGERANPFMATA